MFQFNKRLNNKACFKSVYVVVLIKDPPNWIKQNPIIFVSNDIAWENYNQNRVLFFLFPKQTYKHKSISKPFSNIFKLTLHESGVIPKALNREGCWINFRHPLFCLNPTVSAFLIYFCLFSYFVCRTNDSAFWLFLK